MAHHHIHIGFDAKRAAQNKTGLGNYSRFVIKGLAQYAPSMRLHLFVPDAGKTRSLGGVDHFGAVTMHFPKTAFWRHFKGLWRSWGVVAHAKRKHVQLYHGLSGELPYGLKSNGIKSVVTIHDLIFMRFPKYYPLIDRLIYRWKMRSACRRADHVIAVSECTKRDIMHYFGTPEEKISVLYQGCDDLYRQPTSEGQRAAIRRHFRLPERFILYVGSIEERKNLMLLAKALTLLPDQEIGVVALGHKTAYAKRVKKYVQEQGLRNRFRIISGVAFEDMPAFYQMAEAFVYPSRYEGFGIPMLEALCSGIPAIGCTGSCLEEAGGPSSLYVDPDDAQGLADALTRVLTDEALRERMIADGHAYADRFKTETLTLPLQQLYASLL